MHVIVATDGSQQSLAAAQQLKAFADPSQDHRDHRGRGDQPAGCRAVRQRAGRPRRSRLMTRPA